MNKKEQEIFVAFFEEVFEAEEAYEFIKKKMMSCSGYNPHLLFQLISARSENIYPDQLRTYLLEKVACNERELYEIFQKFDGSRAGSISRADFIREITPIDEAQPKLKNEGGYLSAEIEDLFLALLMEYTKRFRIIEVARKQVSFIPPYNAFAEVDQYRLGIIGLGELQRFLEANDFQVSQKQLHLLLHGLRRRCYLEVNLEVFCENLDPLEFGQYQKYSSFIEKEQQTQTLSRSRREQETMRRSRMEAQKMEHQIHKQERRKRAQLERELELEERINKEIRDHQEKKQMYIRKALLQEDKNIRWNVQSGSRYLEEESLKNELEMRRIQERNNLMSRQKEINEALARSAYYRQNELEESRRADLYRRERQLAQREQIERQRELIQRDLIERQSRIELQDKIRKQQLTASRSIYSSGLYH